MGRSIHWKQNWFYKLNQSSLNRCQVPKRHFAEEKFSFFCFLLPSGDGSNGRFYGRAVADLRRDAERFRKLGIFFAPYLTSAQNIVGFFLTSSLVLAPTWAGGSVPLEKASYQSAFLVFLCPMPFIIVSSTATQWVRAIWLITFNSELTWSVHIHVCSRATASLVALGYQDRLLLASWSYRLAASPFCLI